MKPEPSTRNTCFGAAEGDAAVAGRASAMIASFTPRPSCSPGLPRRRALVRALRPGALRRRHRDADMRVGRRGAAVDEPARAIGAFDMPGRREVQIDPRVAERAAAAIAGRDHLVDLD